MKNLRSKLRLTIILVISLLSFGLFSQKPSIYFEPGTLEATVGPNDSTEVHSVLHNATDYTVEFYFPGFTSRDQGGPDDFGYSWIDSEQDGGPDWSWTDISEIGYQIEGLGDDQVAGPFEMDFDFPYYGQTKTQFWISPNGVICFNDPFVSYANHPIPTNNDYADFIAWFWDDLKIDPAISKVYFKNFEEKTIVQFTKMVHYPGTESFITGQVIMMNNGSILMKYRLVSETFETTGATVGIQSNNSELGLQVVYNAEYIHSELAVRFDLNRNFITAVNPSSLTLPPGTQETIWITYSSAGFEPGSYEQDLKCITSHPELPHVLLHNVMHVTNPNQAGFKGYVTNSVSGLPINDVKVIAGEQYVYTGENGHYELPLEQGSYNVHFVREGYQPRIIEDTTALPGFSILNVVMEPIYSYFLVGRVYAGDNFLESGFAYGYKMIEGNVVDVTAEMVGVEGWYEFTGLAPAGYIVKAEPSINSDYYGSYLPTYYGDVLHWEEATMINLTGNTDGAHIHLVPLVNAPQGPGSISGTISNSNRTADVPIILRTVDPAAVVMALSSSDGSFAFNDLAYGTYEIFAEITGKSTTPMSVELNETNPSVGNVDMMILENEIVFLGIGESDVFETMPYIYPNPVKERLNIVFNMKKDVPVKIDIMEISGRVVYSEIIDIHGQKEILINLNDLSGGVYLMKMEAGEEVIVRRLIKN